MTLDDEGIKILRRESNISIKSYEIVPNTFFLGQSLGPLKIQNVKINKLKLKK